MSAVAKAESAYWHQGRILFALARYFDYLTNRMMTQFFIDGGIADLVFVSRHGYATEVEIKISLADWNADLNKGKWDMERPHVARFFYAIPETLETRIPPWVPRDAGILVCRRQERRVEASIRFPNCAPRSGVQLRNSRMNNSRRSTVLRISVSGGRKWRTGSIGCSIDDG